MKKYITILTLILSLQLNAQPRISEGNHVVSQILGQEIKYSVLLPEDYYSSKKSYPVVYLLHGLGDSEYSWLEYGRISQQIDIAVKKKEIVPMIYVMPQGYRTYYVNDYAGKFSYQDMFIKELIPHIDATYRTKADRNHRATLGYSMGGFGAYILPFKNPDIFSVSVPLSISVRTDDQYMTEESPWWDDQWGKWFGGEGLKGEERLTPYYKDHSPFYVFNEASVESLKKIKLYIDNGDDEGSLAKSNEMLHMLLRDINFPHEFRVRDGGHSFSYWRVSFANGIRFISDAFEGKPYRGDISYLTKPANVSGKNLLQQTSIGDVLLPEDYHQTNRLYPTLYVVGRIQMDVKNKVASMVRSSMKEGTLLPIIVCFVDPSIEDISQTAVSFMQSNYRIRDGYRFKALIGIGEFGNRALTAAITPEKFTTCVLFDVNIDNNVLFENKKAFSKTWLFIKTTSGSNNYKSNGHAHIFLKEHDIYHEYRVTEDADFGVWIINQLPEAFTFIQKKIHR
jgi:enterochelin esterase-like enzyme